MISKETEEKLVNILKTLAKGEMSIEITRNLLSDNLDFDPYQIFTNLIQKGNEFITPLDILNYFNTKKIFISYTEAKLLILFYDQNYDEVLTYSEFLPIVQSKNSSKNNSVNSPIKEMSQDIDYYLIKLFQKEVDLIREIIKLLYDIRVKKDFDCHNIYHTLKNANKITEDSIGDFFEKTSTSYINDELIAIIKRLDINKDGIIDLCELHAFFNFPNCNFCCSCTPCSICGTCCCNECLPDIPCYLHKCIHHQCHSPLEKKTICNSPLKNRMYSPEKSISSRLRNININLNNNISRKKYFNNSDLYFEEEEKNNIFDYKNKNPKNKKTFIEENNNNIELKSKSNPKIKYSSPKKYYINSQSGLESTLYSSSPLDNTDFFSTISNPKKSLNFSNFSNFHSNSVNNGSKNGYIEGQFKEYLKILMKVEKEIEKGKIELSLCNDFNFENAFNIFDSDCKCFINFDDLKDGFIKLGLEVRDEELKLLFNRLDPQKCGCINYENFSYFLSPSDNIYRNNIERRKCYSERGRHFLSIETKLYFKNLLKLIISGEKKLNELREGYENIKNSVTNIFGLIDLSRTGYFFEQDLKNYLIDTGIFIDDKSCTLLFFKLDKNGDGKVDICEIEEEFQKVI